MPEDVAILQQRFWQFSLERYARDHVQKLSIELQDRYGFDVNLIFFCLWLADTQQQSLNQQAIEVLRRRSRELNDNIVTPVRSARRWLNQRGGFNETDAHAYSALKEAELRCEAMVQRALVDRFISGLSSAPTDDAQTAATASLGAYGRVLGLGEEPLHILTSLISLTID